MLEKPQDSRLVLVHTDSKTLNLRTTLSKRQSPWVHTWFFKEVLHLKNSPNFVAVSSRIPPKSLNKMDQFFRSIMNRQTSSNPYNPIYSQRTPKCVLWIPKQKRKGLKRVICLIASIFLSNKSLCCIDIKESWKVSSGFYSISLKMTIYLGASTSLLLNLIEEPMNFRKMKGL